MMIEDQSPPTPPPPASQAPYPAHPAPHPHSDTPPPAPIPHDGPTIGALGVVLIGGAVATAVGLLLTVPFFRRKPTPAPKAAPKRAVGRKPATKSTTRRPAARKPSSGA